ncbi:helix-turn-helix transcriptional regulator [Colwellia sp. MB3u-70]|uniref:AraC family transcriptional regulator n=1 Tax=unclassified Colwellia TaxID=196834 RepID=UPI0015F5FD32|nr:MULTISPECIES: AraC family transcriptional regulator [unclassified Colwellia]MBA6291885.1 helix-turn-helix transcriptional regulator [Colwellia sp. MB3u-8]MBA6308529.1 helix-turn-helix transcriptional regulator [Colwellia sp. MB3u-70]
MLWTSSVVLHHDIEQHHHNLHEFVVCLQGSVNISIKDEVHHFSAGHSIFIPAKYPHTIAIDKHKATKLLFVCINPPSFDTLSNPTNRLFLNTLSEGGFLINNNPLNTDDSTEEMQKIAHEIQASPDSSSLLHASLKENLYLRLLLIHMSSVGYEQKTSAQSSLRMTKAQHWIHDNYAMDITLEMVANQVNISRSHFARQFRQHTGFSVIEYLLKVRCDAVAKLLASSDTDITAVAFATGFSNLSHLYRHFKRRYGITPGAFRQMIKNQGSTLTKSPNEEMRKI